jgi:hypothetical protein
MRSEAASGGDGDLNLGPKGRQGREDSEATGNSAVSGANTICHAPHTSSRRVSS